MSEKEYATLSPSDKAKVDFILIANLDGFGELLQNMYEDADAIAQDEKQQIQAEWDAKKSVWNIFASKPKELRTDDLWRDYVNKVDMEAYVGAQREIITNTLPLYSSPPDLTIVEQLAATHTAEWLAQNNEYVQGILDAGIYTDSAAEYAQEGMRVTLNQKFRDFQKDNPTLKECIGTALDTPITQDMIEDNLSVGDVTLQAIQTCREDKGQGRE